MTPDKSSMLPTTEADVATDVRTKPAVPWYVVLHDDNDHSYEYVILMLMDLFGHTFEKAYQFAREVDASGRAIVDTTSRERAELKVDQIHAYGADPRIPRCAGSMSASIEPAKD